MNGGQNPTAWFAPSNPLVAPPLGEMINQYSVAPTRPADASPIGSKQTGWFANGRYQVLTSTIEAVKTEQVVVTRVDVVVMTLKLHVSTITMPSVQMGSIKSME
jgi:hypothetical protein